METPRESSSDREVVDDVRPLLGHPLLGLGVDRLDDLAGLLAHLVTGELGSSSSSTV
jgi:hypothetical protein